jgi:hypothetical protein
MSVRDHRVADEEALQTLSAVHVVTRSSKLNYRYVTSTTTASVLLIRQSRACRLEPTTVPHNSLRPMCIHILRGRWGRGGRLNSHELRYLQIISYAKITVQ